MKLLSTIFALGLSLLSTTNLLANSASNKIIIAHGVAGAGLNSRLSFQNGIDMKADYIEADLQLTKDGYLICLHDPTLENFTNVEALYPKKFKSIKLGDKLKKKWYINDLTLSEIRSLDTTNDVVTLNELFKMVQNKAGLYLETKDPYIYKARGLDIDLVLHEFLTTENLKTDSKTKTPIIIESFHEASLRRLRELGGSNYTLIQLVWFSTWHQFMSPEGLKHVASYADGIGPLLSMILPPSQTVIKDAHQQNLVVHAWKGYEQVPPKGMTHQDYANFLFFKLGIDGLMTNKPDQIKLP